MNLTPVTTLALQRKAYAQRPVPTYSERWADLNNIRRLVLENQEAIISAIRADYGHRSRHETQLTELAQVLASIRHATKHLRGWMRPKRRAVDRLSFGLSSNRVVPQPLGVVGVIVPWNFPINLSLVPLVGIFAAGNRAMVKLSENSRHLAALLIEISPHYFPLEKLAFLDETGGVGIEFSQLPFDHLLFTGSGITGRAVMKSAAENLCPVTLELGGKCPAIIVDDFDLRVAMERILFVKCLNAGQICTSVDHLFVPRAKLAQAVQFAKEIVPTRYADINSEDYTSIIDQKSYQRLIQSLVEARAQGVEVVSLFPEPSEDESRRRLAPHIVIDPPANSTLMQREIFGPILPIIPYDDLNEVIDQINARDRPLAIYPFSNHAPTIEKIIHHTMSGGVSVNDALFHVAQEDLPFGGVGKSGMGHYHGEEGFLTFSKLRPIFYQSRFATSQLLMPPYRRWTQSLIRFLMRS